MYAVDCYEEQELCSVIHVLSSLCHIVWVAIEQIMDDFQFHAKENGAEIVKQFAVRIKKIG